jgi:hypothetical protein
MGFLAKSDPVGLTLLLSLWMPFVLGNVTPESVCRDFLQHFLAEQHSTFIQKYTFNSISDHVHSL